MTLLNLIIALAITFISTLVLVIPIKKSALKYGFSDHPSTRKIHKKVMPTLGGLAMFIGTALGLLYLRPEVEHMTAIASGAIVITVDGIIDDKFQITPQENHRYKLIAT